jgi:hypothetical protein
MSDTARQLIQAVEQRGGYFVCNGDDLTVYPREAGLPLVDDLRANKEAIIEALAERPQMPAGVRLIRWQPVPAPVRLSQCDTVTDSERFIRTSLAQLEAAMKGRNWQAGNWGLYGLLERLALCGCVIALDNPRRAVQ